MSPAYEELHTVRQKNQVFDSAGLEWLGFRLPGLRVETYFYYKVVEEGPYSIGWHGHDHWEFSRPVRGRLAYELEANAAGETAVVEPDTGSYFLVPPGVAHRWELVAGPLLLNSWQIRFFPEDEAGEALLEHLRAATREQCFISPATALQVDAEDLLWELCGSDFYPSVIGPMISGVARIVIGGLVGGVRPWPRVLRDREGTGVPSSENLAIKLKEFLEANLHHSITLVDMESHFHYSSRHLNRVFHQYYHASIGQYLRDRRFELASRWLATTNRSIKDIALSLGYGNISHFCRYFRKRKNLSPSEYRERVSGEMKKDTFSSVTHPPLEAKPGPAAKA